MAQEREKRLPVVVSRAESFAPAYAEMAKDSEEELVRLKEITTGRSTPKAGEIPRLLQTVSSKIMSRIRQRIHNANRFKDREVKSRKFQIDFGHLPLYDEYGEKIVATQSIYALAHSKVLSLLGSDGKVGTLTFVGYALPTVRVKGTTYVFDHHLRSDEPVPTASAFIKHLASAQSRPKDELYFISKVISGGMAMTPRDLAAKFRYFGGESSAVSAFYVDLAKEFNNRGNEEAVLRQLRKSLAAEPRYLTANAWMGQLHLERHKYWDAADYFKKALDGDPTDPYLNVHYGKCLVETGRARKAEKLFRHLVSRDRKNIDFRHGLGYSLFRQGKLSEARDVLNRTLKELPAQLGHAATHQLIAKIDETLGFSLARDSHLEESEKIARKWDSQDNG